MRAAIVIPARLGSSRLPGKLLLRETGTPLVCHTLLVAAKARDVSNGMFREVVVAADSERIVAEVERFNAANRLRVEKLFSAQHTRERIIWEPSHVPTKNLRMQDVR